MKTVETGALGWQHEAWNDTYYPEDLPEDWRLDYYSHHFNFVVIRQVEWRQATRDDITQWLEDVPDDFLFYLSVDAGNPDSGLLDQLLLITSIMGKRLSGILPGGMKQHVPNEMIMELSRLVTVYVDVDDSSGMAGNIKYCWRPGRKVAGAALGILPAESTIDMRGMRVCIQEFLAQGEEDQDLRLVFEGEPPSVKAMQDAQVIIEMLT